MFRKSRIKFQGHGEMKEGIAYLFGEGDRYVLVLHESELESASVCNLFEFACASACARFEVSPASIEQFIYIGMRISLAPFHWNGVAFALKEDGTGPWPQLSGIQAEDIIGERLPTELEQHIEEVIAKYHWLDR